MAELTEKDFRRYLNTRFHINFDNDEKVELELVEVKPYQAVDVEAPGYERFSLYFAGPPNIKLPQYTYPLQHAEIGEYYMFLVPLGVEERGQLYEAVFNFKISEDSEEKDSEGNDNEEKDSEG